MRRRLRNRHRRRNAPKPGLGLKNAHPPRLPSRLRRRRLVLHLLWRWLIAEPLLLQLLLLRCPLGARSLAPGLLSLRPSPMVAREAERQDLMDVVLSVCAGQPPQHRMVALIGERGGFVRPRRERRAGCQRR